MKLDYSRFLSGSSSGLLQRLHHDQSGSLHDERAWGFFPWRGQAFIRKEFATLNKNENGLIRWKRPGKNSK